MPHPSPTTAAAAARPALDSPDSAVALVTTVPAAGPDRQRAVAEAVARHGEDADAWPRGLTSLTVYLDEQEDTVLIYTQWSSEQDLDLDLDLAEAPWPIGVGLGADEGAVGSGEATATAFRHYRTVRGTALTEPAPVPESFPVAFFDTADEDAARTWLDGLLTSEERSEGEDRAYPGAVAAHLHISLDGTKVLSFSEWLTEDQAVAHIEAVWAPVLKEFGGTGRLHRHFGTYVR
ncbi:hypothetical protein ABZT51_41790 [Streptomyces sp. NPDC005373]|uniref:hypothetical protein n=1 Tax=Streptomyces sp. NPDC005373 TaxID=3156879 RepID=UPI00339F6240